MNALDLFVIYFFTGIQFQLSQGAFTCFKKFRRKSNDCGGRVKRKALYTAADCCTDIGNGFTNTTLEVLGRNRYSCISCDDWEREQNKIEHEVTTMKEDFRCFRKFREKRQQCGGPIKPSKASNVVECCRGPGNGFSLAGLDQKGKNRYTCESCEDWLKEQTTSTPKTITTTQVPTEWGPWGDCSTTCGTGWRSRYRYCVNCGDNRGLSMQSEPCIIHYYCQVDGAWSEWLTWTSCTASCDGGVRRRQRFCNNPRPLHGGKLCAGEETEEESCSEEPCPVDGHWGQWSWFGMCSQTCGRGTMTRTRECNSPTPKGGGQLCRGPSVESRLCERRKCPIHGGWSSWEEWSTCAVTCGTSMRTRSRACDRPQPRFDGYPCVGTELESEICSVETPCPVDGGWSEWSDFGSCRGGPCQTGHRLRTRVCDNPRPRDRGRMCSGRSAEQVSCFNEEGCPVDGGWCDFSGWSSCSTTCSDYYGTRTRTRACYCPAPQNGGKSCEGNYVESEHCIGNAQCLFSMPDVQ